MFCTKCGAQVVEGTTFCTSCGAPLEEAQQTATPRDPYEPTTQMDYGAAGQQPTMGYQQEYQQSYQQGYQQADPYAPVFVDDPRRLVSNETKKSGKSTAIIVALVAVVIVLAVGIGAYFMVSGNNATATNTNSNVAAANANTNENTNTNANTNTNTNTTASSDTPHATSDTPSTTNTTNIGPSSSSSSSAGTTVNLTVVTAGGSTLSGVVHRDADGYVIADSSTREYSKSELRALDLTDAELCIAWNEPFAREGYHFKNSSLQNYFNSCSWYTDEGKTLTLSGAAATNNTLLREIADENSSSKQWENLATS